MQLDFNLDKSIYLQIAEQIEDSILQNALEEESQVPSTNQMAALYRINPATAGKGINILVDNGILYKQRGIGMFVAAGARKRSKRGESKCFTKNISVRCWPKPDNWASIQGTVQHDYRQTIRK